MLLASSQEGQGGGGWGGRQSLLVHGLLVVGVTCQLELERRVLDVEVVSEALLEPV